MAVPEELKALKQWCYSVKGNKMPLRAGGFAASVSNPNSWGEYDKLPTQHYRGFILTDKDPYTFIDLDKYETNKEFADEIIALFNSYTEYSLSKNGFHIIVKGTLPKNIATEALQAFSCSKYMITTGEVYNGLDTIEERQEDLDKLYQLCGNLSGKNLQDSPQTMEDNVIIEMATNAANSEKFKRLYDVGIWHEFYPSQSEADFALMSMLSFYSKNNEQCKRLFNKSALRRPKSILRLGYLDDILHKQRAKEIAPVEIIPMVEAVEKKAIEVAVAQEETPFSIMPNGLIKDIFTYVYKTSARPVEELSFCGALTMFAGLVGRQFNIYGTGLNVYVLALASTGTGKEAMASGTDKLMDEISLKLPASLDFVGSAYHASGQALIKDLVKKPCQYVILGEFSSFLEQIHISPAAKTVKQTLLNIYQKSGFGNTYRGMVYSDNQKNIPTVPSPCLSVLGECTPEHFFDVMDDSLIKDGFLPRFLVVEHKGKRSKLNTFIGFQNTTLVDDLQKLIQYVLQMKWQLKTENITISDKAVELLAEFDTYCDDAINTGTEFIKQLWNRAHLNCSKLCGLFSVSQNWVQPVVTEDIARWCVQFTKKSVLNIIHHFDKGEIGNDDGKRNSLVINRIRIGLTTKPKSAQIFPPKFHGQGIVPLTYIKHNAMQSRYFSKHPMGGIKALELALKSLCNDDIIRQLPASQALERFNCRQPLYIAGDMFPKEED